MVELNKIVLVYIVGTLKLLEIISINYKISKEFVYITKKKKKEILIIQFFFTIKLIFNFT